MIDKRKKSLFLSSQKRAEWFKMSLVEQWHPPEKSIHHRQRHSPTYPTVGGVVEVHIGMCTLMRPNSRSWSCGFILKGLVPDLLFLLLLKDDLSLSMVSGVPLHSPLSVFWVWVVCSLHLCVMDLRGITCNFNCSRGSYNNSIRTLLDFPRGSEGKASACIAGDLGSIPGSGRSPGEGNDKQLQYSCLENPMDRSLVDYSP